MPTAMAENTTNFQRQINHGVLIPLNRIEVPSKEHEEMKKMAHLRFKNVNGCSM